MNNAQRKAQAAKNYLNKPLPADPKVGWRLLRNNGLALTLPVDMESQSALREERRLALANVYQEIEA